MTTLSVTLTAEQEAQLTKQGWTAPTPAPPTSDPTASTTSPLSSVTKIGSTPNPPSSVAGQRWEFYLIGSGGSFNPSTGALIAAGGDLYQGTGDATLGESPMRNWFLQNGLASAPFLRVHATDQTRTTRFPNGMETFWMGYVHGGVFSAYTERFLDALIAEVLATQPVIAQRAVATGNSMGAWGGLTFAMRRPSVFAAVLVTQPRWKVRSCCFDDKVNGTAPAGLMLDDGRDFATVYDNLAYIADPANTLPLLVWTVATSDVFTAFADHQAAIATFRARVRNPTANNLQRSGFAFGWVPGGHGAADVGTPPSNALIWSPNYPTGCYNPADWRTDLGYPVFDNSSLDDDVTTAPSGFVNNGFAWRNVVESASGWSCEISNKVGAVTVDVYPHSAIYAQLVTAPQRVTIPAAQWVTVAFPVTAPAPAPDPAPAPTPTPTPTPAPGALTVPAISSSPLNEALTITDTFQYSGGRYERFKQLLVINASPFDLPIQASGWGGGGTTNVTFGYPRIDVGIATVATEGAIGPSNVRGSLAAPTSRTGKATLTLADEPDGPCLVTLYGVDASGHSTTLIEHGAYIDRTGAAKNHPYCWVQNCSNDWEAVNNARGYTVQVQRALVKIADMQPSRVQPLPERLGPAFADAALPVNLTRRELVPGGMNYGVPSQLRRTKSGIWHTEDRQDYFYSDLVSKIPRLPLLDGPRGVCTAPMTTDIIFGRQGKVYGANPWQAWVIDATGTKRTLYGLRHLYPITWEEACSPGDPGWDSMMEIVGNWDASIPLAERFAWESWGMAWDQRTLLPIDDAAPIPPGETEHPHYSPGPTHFRTDRHGYVLRVQSSPISHATPPTITRWCAANDPWGIACVGNLLYVTERGANRISIFSADTPNTYLGAVIEDTTASTLGAIDQGIRRWRGANAETCRTHTIVAPEGLVYQDGYLYWGSLAQGEVRRVPVAGGAPEVVAQPYCDNNSNYIYIAISDGNFGPRGAVAATTWSVTNNGRPHIYLPTPGTASDGTPLTHAVEWQWDGEANGIIQGRGPHWNTDSYGSAVAFGYAGSNPPRPDDPPYGALACTSANGNISVYTLADDTLDGPARTATQQAAFDAAAKAGLNWYRANAQVLHGIWCSGPDYALPWGQDANADTFMRACGYAP